MTQGQTADTTPVQDRSAVAWSYASGPSETPLLGMTIGDALDQTAARYPTNEALIVRQQDVRYTYAELKREVDRCARALMALGIEKGQRVGIWAPNRAEWIITQLGTAKIGAILVNVNPAYRLNELEYVLNQSGCTMLVMAPEFRTGNYTQMMQTLCPELERSAPGQLDAHKLPRLRHVVRLGGAEGEQRAPGMWV